MSTNAEVKASELKIIENEDLAGRTARYVEIWSNKWGSKLTVGGLYEIKRSYGSPHIYGDEGEMYIIDDEGKDAYCFQMLCDVTYYE